MPTDEMSAEEYNALVASERKRKRSKYGNRKVTVDGIRFDSMAEGQRYWDLRQLERSGEITELELQPAFPLLVQSVKIATYVADFRYRDNGGRLVVEDVKSDVTRKNRAYRLKVKHLKAQYGIYIT